MLVITKKQRSTVLPRWRHFQVKQYLSKCDTPIVDVSPGCQCGHFLNIAKASWCFLYRS